ncbi:hypothetical protein M3J09_009601 [Ascochyta lentis]
MTTHEEASASTVSTDKAAAYDTLPLAVGNSSNIRLLEILNNDTNDGDGPISCNLRLASLDEKYVALSYMWGTETATKSIKLNGKPFLVRQNLWDFLHQRRIDQSRDNESRYLWIDALCINQASNTERNHQVGMMGRIYSRASHVLIWLGAGNESLAREMDYLASPQAFDRAQANIESVPFSEIIQLCFHPYWRRAWILQECVLALVLRLQCGPKCVCSSTLFKILSLSYSYSISEDLRPEHRSASTNCLAREVLFARQAWHQPSNRHFFTPWERYLPLLGCSDPRDRIYAMVAIMDPAFELVPDYNMTAQDLFVAIVDRIWAVNEGSRVRLSDIARLLELDFLTTEFKDWPPLVYQKFRQYYDKKQGAFSRNQ